MGKSLTTNNGNDCVETPVYFAKLIVEHYNPKGKILEPCIGIGNFLKVLPKNTDWCEIKKKRDFLTIEGHWNWIITNPPYSKYRLFLNKAMEVSDNIVFLQLINATFYKGRLKDIVNKKFGIKEIWCVDTPKEFTQFGFQMGCVYYRRNYKGKINFIYPIIKGD